MSDTILTLMQARQEMLRAALRISLATVGGGSASDEWWKQLAEAGRKLADAQDAMDADMAERRKRWPLQ